MRRSWPLLLIGVVGLCAFLGGLASRSLRTGSVDPLDWLWPGLAVVLLLIGYLDRAAIGRNRVSLGLIAALVVVPPLAFVFIASSRMPFGHAGLLILSLASVCIIANRWRASNGALLSACVAAGLVPVAVSWMARPVPVTLPGVQVAVLSGPPLIGAEVPAARGEGLVGDAGPVAGSGVLARTPLWNALAVRLPLRPIDALEARSLAGARALLIVQPRLLQRKELVLLDQWVRDGGRAVILADPLLLWADARHAGHPRRPPLTSLLDPLFTHWGLVLEPAAPLAQGVADERRLLADGYLLTLIAASRFKLTGDGTAHCRLSERGLVADCTVGRGRATLIADADFLEDAQWTLAPDRPTIRAMWTSDAIPFVESRLEGSRADSAGIWLIDGNRMLAGMGAAVLALALLLVLGRCLRAFPTSTQVDEIKKRNFAGP